MFGFILGGMYNGKITLPLIHIHERGNSRTNIYEVINCVENSVGFSPRKISVRV